MRRRPIGDAEQALGALIRSSVVVVSADAGARTPSRAVPRTRLAQAVPWVATRGSIRGACGGREVVLRTVGNPASSFVEPRPEVAAVRPGQGLVPKRVCIFVEPSPFTYVCGYKNRFCNLIRYLREAGCEVLVITTGEQGAAECAAVLSRARARRPTPCARRTRHRARGRRGSRATHGLLRSPRGVCLQLQLSPVLATAPVLCLEVRSARDAVCRSTG